MVCLEHRGLDPQLDEPGPSDPRRRSGRHQRRGLRTWLRRETCDCWLDMESETLVADLEEVLHAVAPRMHNQP